MAIPRSDANLNFKLAVQSFAKTQLPVLSMHEQINIPQAYTQERNQQWVDEEIKFLGKECEPLTFDNLYQNNQGSG